jgi:heme-degrading monooxygenase HmoA
MQSRQICFYAERADVPHVMAAVQSHVSRRYKSLPSFLGMTVIKRDTGRRSEVIVTSFWDDSLGSTDTYASRFIDEIHRLTGTNASQKDFDTLYALVRDTRGTFRSGPDSASTGSASNSVTNGPTDRGTLYSAGSSEEMPSDGPESR